MYPEFLKYDPEAAKSTAPEPDEMLKPVYGYETITDEWSAVKAATDTKDVEIEAYGIKLKPKKVDGMYLAHGVKLVDTSKNASLYHCEVVFIDITRCYKAMPDGRVTYVDIYQLTLQRRHNEIVSYYTDNSKESLAMAFEKLLQMRDVAYTGWPAHKPSRFLDC